MKKLHVIFYNIRCYLSGLDLKINNKKKQIWFNFWDELQADSYFNVDNGIVQIKCVKLTNNMYQIKIPVINTPILITSYIIAS